MRNITTLSILVTLGTAATATAQVPWNRGTEGIAILPDTAGGWSVHAFFSASATESTAPLDLGTEVMLVRNGSPMQSYSHDITGGGSSGGCSFECHTVGQSCVCFEGTSVCGCGSIVLCIDGIGCVPAGGAEPGDEIMVILRPSPGAQPEVDDTDDQRAVNFSGTPLFWNRRLTTEAEYVGDQFFDIVWRVDFEGTATGPLKLGAHLQLIDGATGAVMAEHEVGGTPGGAPAEGTFPHVALPPGTPDPIVRLVPLPGALPELPGFDEDDEETVDRFCAEDVDEDGIVGVTDLLAVLAAWESDDEDADVNDDGIVDIADLLALLAKWGPCPAV